MEKLLFHIHGFKCFADSIFELNKLTLLTGANASGKSSVIQALLLLKVASESEDSPLTISLNDQRNAFDFGTPDSLINNEFAEDEVTISFSGNALLRFKGEDQKSERKLYVRIDDLTELKSFFTSGFTYFCAERQGPRFEHVKYQSYDNGCGCHGENTGNVISDNWNTKIPGSRLFNPISEDVMFNIALDSWVDYIFPGISVRIQQAGINNYQVIVRDNNHRLTTNSTNIGFGISYALPILVGALLANSGSWLVVENPEAHLHAKAQSNMGFFLGIMSAMGMRIVVETHSEHIVNGIRRTAFSKRGLHPENVNIYFFRGKSDKSLITIDNIGNLSDFPVDFFDQIRQDLFEIINKTRG